MYQSVAATATGRRCTRVAPLALVLDHARRAALLPCCPVVFLPGRIHGVIRRRAERQAHCTRAPAREVSHHAISAVAVHGEQPTEWMRSRVLASHPWTSRPPLFETPTSVHCTHSSTAPRNISLPSPSPSPVPRFAPSPVSMII